MGLLFISFVLILAAPKTNCGIYPKFDFSSDDLTPSDPEDVEVKHTIIVSTKLNNRKGIHGHHDDNVQTKSNFAKLNNDEVPVVKGFKAVDTTRIRTPDTRNKPKNTEDVIITRNLQDGYNLYTNFSPSQWKPSTPFNNINWWEQDASSVYVPRSDSIVKFQRKIADESMKNFYCKRCRELSQGLNKDCFNGHSRSVWNFQTYQTSTTPKPKVKIDGKIASLN